MLRVEVEFPLDANVEVCVPYPRDVFGMGKWDRSPGIYLLNGHYALHKEVKDKYYYQPLVSKLPVSILLHLEHFYQQELFHMAFFSALQSLSASTFL